MSKKTISIISPCYNEEASVETCYETVRALFDSQLKDYTYEHIFCDNASSDRTVEILKGLAARDPRVKIIVNSRNFGILRNTYNGVMSSSGDATLLFLPVDLQDPPELIPEFVKLWESGYEVVFGLRKGREEFFLIKWMRKAYYRLLSAIANISYPPDAGDFQLVDRKVIDAMRRYDDVQPFMRMMTFECGFKSVGVPYTWRRRAVGLSRNKFIHMIDQGLNGIISFSGLPLRLCFFGGFFIAACSLIYALTVAILRMVNGPISVQGVPTLIIAVFFFGGLNLLFLGFMGEYVVAIYNQVRKRPIVIERERVNFK